MQNIGQQLGHGGLEDFRSHPALVSADAVGVELELEGFSDSDIDTARRHLQPLWTITSDGSLRNGGVEFITTGGKGGETLHQAFERITSCLRDRVNYDASWRCSTHMHINMLDFTCNQVARFVMVYAACEPVLFHLAGSLRRSSNFCTPLADSLGFHKKLIARMYDDTVSTRAGSGHTSKYTALNLQPLFGNQNVRPLGTVEFRGGRPMTTMEELLLQTNLLLSIKQFVRTFEGTEEQMLIKLNDGVFNTVYANGCASSLQSVDVNELETALIHSWLLLKSYQQGIASERERPTRGAQQGDGLEWLQNAGIRAGAAATTRPRMFYEEASTVIPPQETRAAWTASYMTEEDSYTASNYNSVPDFTANEWPRLYERLQFFCAPHVSNIEKADRIIMVLRDPAFRFRYDVNTAQKVAMNWLLSLSANNPEVHPIGTLIRAAKNRAQGMQSRTECLSLNNNSRNQPYNALLNIEVDYMSRLSAGEKSMAAGYCEVRVDRLTNRVIWDTILNTNITLSGADVLNRRYIERTNYPHQDFSTPEVLPALQAYTLFKLADRPSLPHIVGALGRARYDSMVALAQLLWSKNLAVPVRHVAHGNAERLYCVATPGSVCGYFATRLMAEQHQTSPQRVSAFTGQRIY